MLDFIRSNKKITQGFLVLITLPFAFWGVDSYVRNVDSGTDVASVGDSKISQYELQNALREQQDQFRAQSGGKLDPALFDTPEMRSAVLDSLVTQRLLAQQARTARLSVGNEQLAQFIAAVPSLQENGKFSKTRYDALVAAQGMSKELFEARLRQDMAMQQLMLPVTQAAIPSQIAARHWIDAQLEQREVSEVRLLPDAYLGRVKLATDAVQKYYDANRPQFEAPEQVRVEFVVLGRDAIASKVIVSDADLAAYYQNNQDRYKDAATRRASHILIRVDKDASRADVDAAKAKVDELLAQLRKTPGDFAKLAKQSSQDPGSAEKGGDLDWFGSGMMVKAFEDVAFSLKEGQISDVVRSDFGFHIILVTGIKPEQVRPLADVKDEIRTELKRERGAKAFAHAAEAFGNVVYEQADSLKPAVEQFKLESQSTQWLTKGGKLPAPFDNPKLASAVFSDDAIKNKRNTEAVEIAPGSLVSARVIEHKPAALQALESVKGDIEKRLLAEAAFDLAIKDGEAKQAQLAKGEMVDLKWSPAHSVSRTETLGLPPEALRVIFKADTAKLPAYAGFASPGNGYALYRITSAKRGDAKDEQNLRTLNQQYARVIAEEEFSAWMATLREKYPVEINKVVLESKDR